MNIEFAIVVIKHSRPTEKGQKKISFEIAPTPDKSQKSADSSDRTQPISKLKGLANN